MGAGPGAEDAGTVRSGGRRRRHRELRGIGRGRGRRGGGCGFGGGGDRGGSRSRGSYRKDLPPVRFHLPHRRTLAACARTRKSGSHCPQSAGGTIGPEIAAFLADAANSVTLCSPPPMNRLLDH
ncbi:hypothetical protein E0H45_07165 [Kribbella soli]|uniref:Uncharacterized protein n=1 Tax=Kribbella soli TaxID=1124743 RepID=A0A4R0HP72_9ACTN|nr:hypothetical protein E0H45_07165 [Kribbella soli]